MSIVRKHIEVRGTVQGVGFRPFVHRLASRHGLSGWVLNCSDGVQIEAEGEVSGVDALLLELETDMPPLANIASVRARDQPLEGTRGFEIRASVSRPGELQPLPPDTATCDDCLRELFDPDDRRYRYPFTNCTNCGPRFTVVEGLPYDRQLTTMRGFTMCADCDREYHDPVDRRFHAQPNACPVCGPHIWLAPTATIHDGSGRGEDSLDALAAATELLRAGRIFAIKGLGGFHLACDALHQAAVTRLRERKHRGAKPFAIMFPGVEAIRAWCFVSDAEAELLTSPRRPIVLLRSRRPPDPLNEVGAMLPSTPLHQLLLHDYGGPLIMTSGNLSEEPIAAGNDEAISRLGGIADAFLLHDRDIASRYDDSVARVFGGATVMVRRARGYAPEPLPLPLPASRPLLACGAQLKSTFCLAKNESAFVSQHIGDLENLETLDHYKATLELYERLFQVRPTLVAHDLHPEYLSTKFALGLPDVERVAVQHHHAHIVSCLAEHGLRGPAIGVAYDGLGYGTDGHLWGGEILIAGYTGFQRRVHFREAPMPGGAAAIRKPYRMAVGYLQAWLAGDTDLFEPFLETIDQRELELLRHGANAPLTSSCGRLFDAVSALLGVCREAQYEGQAAMELQALADPSAEESYPWELLHGVIDPAPALRALFQEFMAGTPVSAISMRFHRTVAEFTAEVVTRLVKETGIQTVAVGGGVFQNTLLLSELRKLLPDIYFPRRLPANDGGLSYGQAVIALSLAHG